MNMKKLLIAIACLFSTVTHAITYTPISTLSPTGSTSGWVVTSTGPSSAPVWAASSGGGGTLAISGGGTGQTTQAAALTALLGSSTVPVANGGTGSTSASAARTALGLGTAATVSTGTSGATIPLLSTANTWTLAQTFTVRPTFNGNTPYDTGNLTIANYLTTAAAASTYAPIPAGYTAYTPSVSAISGTYTTVSATGAYTQIGKVVCVRVKVSITTIGTATGTIVSLPFNAASTNGDIQILPGRENASSGKMLQGVVSAGSGSIVVYDYSGSPTPLNGYVQILSGCYVSV
jgi:hypothetical protein